MASKQQDVDVIESWEDIEETDVLEQKLKKLIPHGDAPDNRICNGSMNGSTVNIILGGDDPLRSQYMTPEPTVKILKRPVKDSQAGNDSKSIQPKKTLQQREQEYAQARLRILGQAQGLDKSEDKISSIQCKVLRTTESDNVIRLPRGPDGSKGFTIRR